MRPPEYRRQQRGTTPAPLLARIRSEEAAYFSAPAAAPALAAAAGPGGHAWRGTFTKLMVSLMVMAAVATFAGGTFGSFNATVGNSNSTYQTGTILLSETAPNAGACFSYGATGTTNFTNGNSNTCQPITFAGIATAGNPTAVQGAAKPGDTLHAHVVLTNVGSVNAASVQMSTDPTCTTGNNPNETVHGTATDLCNQVKFFIQEYSDPGFTTQVAACEYPQSSTAVCSGPPGVSSLQNFVTTTSASPLVDLNGLAAGGTRYFDLVMTLPTSTSNSYQGLQLTFNLHFVISQT